jgi:hypothetical protein
MLCKADRAAERPARVSAGEQRQEPVDLRQIRGMNRQNLLIFIKTNNLSDVVIGALMIRTVPIRAAA